MTIAEKTEELKAWAATAAGGRGVVTSPPAVESQTESVSLYLMEMLPEPPERNSRQHVLRVTLRYLVTAGAPGAASQQQLLGDLLFAAMESHAFEVDPAPQSAELWRAFGVPPQPAFCIRAKVWKELPERTSPLVREHVFHVDSYTAGSRREASPESR